MLGPVVERVVEERHKAEDVRVIVRRFLERDVVLIEQFVQPVDINPPCFDCVAIKLRQQFKMNLETL